MGNFPSVEQRVAALPPPEPPRDHYDAAWFGTTWLVYASRGLVTDRADDAYYIARSAPDFALLAHPSCLVLLVHGATARAPQCVAKANEIVRQYALSGNDDSSDALRRLRRIEMVTFPTLCVDANAPTALYVSMDHIH